MTLNVGGGDESVDSIDTDKVNITRDGTVTDDAITFNGDVGLYRTSNGIAVSDASNQEELKLAPSGSPQIEFRTGTSLREAGGVNGFIINPGSIGDNVEINGNARATTSFENPPQDVRNISSPSQGMVAYHDGSGSHTEGPAFYDGAKWVSSLNGEVID